MLVFHRGAPFDCELFEVVNGEKVLKSSLGTGVVVVKYESRSDAMEAMQVCSVSDIPVSEATDVSGTVVVIGATIDTEDEEGQVSSPVSKHLLADGKTDEIVLQTAP